MFKLFKYQICYKDTLSKAQYQCIRSRPHRDLRGGGGWGAGVLPIMIYTGRLRPKGESFSGFRSV